MPSIERSSTGQIIPKETKEYNERLFRRGWRKYLHESRYTWLRASMKRLQLADVSILELGCFDAKTIDYVPFGFSRYVGYDANWERGLTIGLKRWKNRSNITLIESHALHSFNPSNERFDCTIAMETLEHLPLNELEAYVQKLSAATARYCFVSVPYEKGVPLLLKYAYKSIQRKVDEPYTAKELLNAAKGNLSAVQRVEGGHKGFDYGDLLRLISKYFEIEKVSGLPFTWLPLPFNFSVGIVARAKR